MPLFAGEVESGAGEDGSADDLRDGVTVLRGTAEVHAKDAEEVEHFFGADVFAQGVKKVLHIFYASRVTGSDISLGRRAYVGQRSRNIEWV